MIRNPNINDNINYSAMKNFDPTKKLREEYSDKFPYNHLIAALLAQGEHDLVTEFLQKVPDTDKKGYFCK